jgi:hypothetical protein
LLQNDTNNLIDENATIDLDFLFTDSSTILTNLNYPQARITSYTDATFEASNENKINGNLAFWTASSNDNTLGNNTLKRAIWINSSQDVYIDNNLTINKVLTATNTPCNLQNINLGQVDSTGAYVLAYIHGNELNSIQLRAGSGNISRPEGKYLMLLGGKSSSVLYDSGNSHLYGGGYYSAQGIPSGVLFLGDGNGGDVYISGGIPGNPITNQLGKIYLGYNEFNNKITSTYLKGTLYIGDNSIINTLNDKIGIGTQTPIYPLEIENSVNGIHIKVDDESDNNYLIYAISGTSTLSSKFNVSTNGQTEIKTVGTGTPIIFDASTDDGRIIEKGNIKSLGQPSDNLWTRTGGAGIDPGISQEIGPFNSDTIVYFQCNNNVDTVEYFAQYNKYVENTDTYVIGPEFNAVKTKTTITINLAAHDKLIVGLSLVSGTTIVIDAISIYVQSFGAPKTTSNI